MLKPTMTPEQEAEGLTKAKSIAARHGLEAEFLGEIYRVGVQGDDKVYTRVIELIGRFPGHDQLEQISSEISNIAGFCGVTFRISVDRP